VGRVIILRPKKISYDDALAAVSRFKGTLRRAQDRDQEREPARRAWPLPTVR
jgi:hypothetical protein